MVAITRITTSQGALVSKIDISEFSETCIRKSFIKESHYDEDGNINWANCIKVQKLNGQVIITALYYNGDAQFFIGDEKLFIP